MFSFMKEENKQINCGFFNRGLLFISLNLKKRQECLLEHLSVSSGLFQCFPKNTEMGRNLLSTKRMGTLPIFDRETVLVKCSFGVLCKLQISLPRSALMIIDESLCKTPSRLWWYSFRPSIKTHHFIKN